MENLLEGGAAELEKVKEAISDLATKEQEYKDTDRSLKAKTKELEIQRKRVEEKINAAVKKARTELERGFDEELGTAEKAIKEAETRKKNAKAAAVNQRMKRENSSLVDENKVLGAEISSRFKEENVPAFCRSKLYYALFAPNSRNDYLICVAGIVIFAVIIPFIVTRFASTTFLKVLIWVLLVVFFAALYFLISSWTKKGARNEILQQVRPSVDRIADNKKFIKKRNKNIKADPDESQYNLFEYDQQVEAARYDYDTAVSRKEEAIQNFENVESVALRQQMEEEKAPVFQELEKEIEQMRDDLLTRTESYQEASRMMEEYTNLLGEKNIKADKLDELITLINEGKAATVQEALDVQKGK